MWFRPANPLNNYNKGYRTTLWANTRPQSQPYEQIPDHSHAIVRYKRIDINQNQTGTRTLATRKIGLDYFLIFNFRKEFYLGTGLNFTQCLGYLKGKCK